MSLMVVGAPYPNRDGSNRRFEIMLCTPGELIVLTPEPRNRHDKRAVAVFSARAVQIGYLSAERAPYIGSLIRGGSDVRAIFQRADEHGAVIRVAIDDGDPVLPIERERPVADDSGFWPDPEWPDA